MPFLVNALTPARDFQDSNNRVSQAHTLFKDMYLES